MSRQDYHRRTGTANKHIDMCGIIIFMMSDASYKGNRFPQKEP